MRLQLRVVLQERAARDLNIGGNSKLEGVGRAAKETPTSRAESRPAPHQGRITHAPRPDRAGGQAARGPDADRRQRDRGSTRPPRPIHFFSDHGDSGSALVNGQNKLVGLVFGGQDSPARPDLVRLPHRPGPRPAQGHPDQHPEPARGTGRACPQQPAGAGRVVGHLGRGPHGRAAGAAPAYAVRSRPARRVPGAPLGGRRAGQPAPPDHHRLASGEGPDVLRAPRGERPPPRAPDPRRGRGRHPRRAAGADGGGPDGLTAASRLRAAIAEHREAVLALVDDFDDLHELVGRFEESTAHV